MKKVLYTAQNYTYISRTMNSELEARQHHNFITLIRFTKQTFAETHNNSTDASLRILQGQADDLKKEGELTRDQHKDVIKLIRILLDALNHPINK